MKRFFRVVVISIAVFVCHPPNHGLTQAWVLRVNAVREVTSFFGLFSGGENLARAAIFGSLLTSAEPRTINSIALEYLKQPEFPTFTSHQLSHDLKEQLFFELSSSTDLNNFHFKFKEASKHSIKEQHCFELPPSADLHTFHFEFKDTSKHRIVVRFETNKDNQVCRLIAARLETGKDKKVCGPFESRAIYERVSLAPLKLKLDLIDEQPDTLEELFPVNELQVYTLEERILGKQQEDMFFPRRITLIRRAGKIFSLNMWKE